MHEVEASRSVRLRIDTVADVEVELLIVSGNVSTKDERGRLSTPEESGKLSTPDESGRLSTSDESVRSSSLRCALSPVLVPARLLARCTVSERDGSRASYRVDIGEGDRDERHELGRDSTSEHNEGDRV